MQIIGREYEFDILDQLNLSSRPEFLVVYGRRRVGKTFLIKEYFKNNFAFYATGVLGGNTKTQLKFFNNQLKVIENFNNQDIQYI